MNVDVVHRHLRPVRTKGSPRGSIGGGRPLTPMLGTPRGDLVSSLSVKSTPSSPFPQAAGRGLRSRKQSGLAGRTQQRHTAAWDPHGAEPTVLSFASCHTNKMAAVPGPLSAGHSRSQAVANQVQRCLQDLRGRSRGPKERAAATLCSLAMNPANTKAIMDAGAVPALVAAVADANLQKCAENAIKVLSTLIFSDQANCSVIFDADGVKALETAMHLNNSQLAEMAMRALAGLAASMDETTPLREAVKARQAVTALVQALAGENKRVAVMVSSVLCDIPPAAWVRCPPSPSKNSAGARTGEDESAPGVAVENLLRLIQVTRGPDREEAAWALWHLASSVEVADFLLPGLHVLLMLLQSSKSGDGGGTEGTREVAAWLLYIVCSDHAPRVADAPEAVPSLLRALATGGPGTREAAVWAVWELAAHHRGAAAQLYEGGCEEALVQVEAQATAANNPSLAEAAAGARSALTKPRFTFRSIGAAVSATAAAAASGLSPLSHKPESSSLEATPTATHPRKTFFTTEDVQHDPECATPLQQEYRTPPSGLAAARSPASRSLTAGRLLRSCASPSPLAANSDSSSSTSLGMQMGPCRPPHLGQGEAQSPAPRRSSFLRWGLSSSTPAAASTSQGTALMAAEYGDPSSPAARRMQGAIRRIAAQDPQHALQPGGGAMAAVPSVGDVIAERVRPEGIVNAEDVPSTSGSSRAAAARGSRLHRGSCPVAGLPGRLRPQQDGQKGFPYAAATPSKASADNANGIARTLQRSVDPDAVHAALLGLQETVLHGTRADVAALLQAGAIEAAVAIASPSDSDSHPTTRRAAEMVLQEISKGSNAHKLGSVSPQAASRLADAWNSPTRLASAAANRNTEARVTQAVAELMVEGPNTRDTRLHAAGVLRDIASESAGRHAVLASGAVPHLVQMVKKGSVPSKVVAAQALASIGSEAEGQTAVAAAGGVSALCLLTTVDDLDCRHAAVTTLASLTEAPACCEEALRHKALPRLLGCLSRPAAEGLQLPAARVLLSLCQCPGAVPVLKKSEESIPILLAAATDSPPQVSVLLLKALGQAVADDDLRRAAVSAGALPACVRFLRNREIREGAAVAMRNFAIGEANQTALVALDCIPLLREMLQASASAENYEGEVIASASALWNLATNPVARDAITKAGGVAPLLSLAGAAGPPEVRASATGTIANLCSSEGPCRAVASEGGIATLVAVMNEKDQRYAMAAEQATRALRNLISASPSMLEAAVDAHLVEAALRLVAKGTPTGRELAVCALYPIITSASSSAERSGVMAMLISAGAADVLLRHGLASDTATAGLRQASLSALRALLPKPEFRESLISSPAALQGLNVVMVRGDSQSQEVAAYVLWDLLAGPRAANGHRPSSASDRAHRVLAPRAAILAGAIEGLTVVCSKNASSQSNAHRAAVTALEKLTGKKPDSDGREIASDGVQLEAAVSELVEELGPEVPSDRRARALRSIACLTHGRGDAVAAVGVVGGTPLIVDALTAGNGHGGEPDNIHDRCADVREAAARCVWNLCHDRRLARSLLSEGRAVEGLVDALACRGGGGHQDLAAAGAAAGALGCLAAADLTCRETIAERGGLELLLALISRALASGGVPRVVAAAAAALGNLCACTANSVAVVDAGGEATLVAVLVQAATASGRAEAEAERSALLAIANICTVDSTLDAVMTSGAVQAAAAALQRCSSHQFTSAESAERSTTGNGRLAEASARLVRLLAAAHRHRPALADPALVDSLLGVVQPYGTLTSESDDGLRREVTGALRLIAASPEGKACLQEAERPRILVALARDPTDCAVQEEAVHTLWNLCYRCNEARLAVVAAGGVPALVALLRSPSPAVKRAAAGVVCDLSGGSAALRERVLKADAVTPLLRMLESAEVPGKEEAAWAITNLAASAAGRYTIVHLGGASVLARLLSSSTASASTKEVAAWAVNTVAVDPKLRQPLIAAGLLKPLHALLSDPTLVTREAAAEAIKTLQGHGPTAPAATLPASRSSHAAAASSGEAGRPQVEPRSAAEELQSMSSVSKRLFADPGNSAASGDSMQQQDTATRSQHGAVRVDVAPSTSVEQEAESRGSKQGSSGGGYLSFLVGEVSRSAKVAMTQSASLSKSLRGKQASKSPGGGKAVMVQLASIPKLFVASASPPPEAAEAPEPRPQPVTAV